VCVCVYERGRERESVCVLLKGSCSYVDSSDSEYDPDALNAQVCVRVCDCVCVCVCVWMCVCTCVCVCVCMKEGERERVCVCASEG